MAQILGPLEANLPAGAKIRHKTAWLRYLADETLPVSPESLRKVVRRVVRLPENAPRGQHLLELRVRHRFTLYDDGSPHRPEEALERLVAASNPPDVFNQVPVRGGKESLDLVRMDEQSRAECIELKPWRSTDTPLYALAEQLKNLEIMRLLAERGVGFQRAGNAGQSPVRDIALTLLAPLDYYHSHGLVGRDGGLKPEEARRAEDLLAGLAETFHVPLAFCALDFPMKDFQTLCLSLVPSRAPDGKIDVGSLPPLPPLERKHWLTVVES